MSQEYSSDLTKLLQFSRKNFFNMETLWTIWVLLIEILTSWKRALVTTVMYSFPIRQWVVLSCLDSCPFGWEQILCEVCTSATTCSLFSFYYCHKMALWRANWTFVKYALWLHSTTACILWLSGANLYAFFVFLLLSELVNWFLLLKNDQL